MPNEVILDVESTTFQKGHPFFRSNKLCCVGLLVDGTYTYYPIEHGNKPYDIALGQIKSILENTRLVIGHNLKYDLNWLKVYIPDLALSRIWDTQLYEYMRSGQTQRMPSLDSSCERRSLGRKSDYIEQTYWSQGIDTLQVPAEELQEYNCNDCNITYQLYQAQKEELKEKSLAFKNLFQLHCDDLLCLQEIETNGQLYDIAASRVSGDAAQKEYDEIVASLKEYDPNNVVNWNSGDHVSAVLYGGSIPVHVREKVTKQFKAGPKDVERWGIRYIKFPRLIDPLKDSERKKEGFFKLNETILRSLRPNTKAVRTLLERLKKLSDLEKLMSTYYFGLPKLMEEMQWVTTSGASAGVIHGQFNQCVTRTGRLSSSRPNQQNFDERIKNLFRSRYED